MWAPSKKASLWIKYKEYIEEKYDEQNDTLERKIKENAPKKLKESFDLFKKEEKEIDDYIKEQEKNGIIIEV